LYNLEVRLEDFAMLGFSAATSASRGIMIAAAACGIFLAGCDEHVRIIRDPGIPIAKHSTWAWRPMETRKEARNPSRNDRPVISRDVIGRGGETVTRESDPATEIDRRQFQNEIERQLTARGLTQVSDPAAADFLADYHFAAQRRNVTVEHVYPGAYPGLVCGPFGCWEGWGYGPPAVGYENIRFREGTFVFDFVESRSRRLAYRAIGQKPEHKAQFSHDQIEDMVHALLKDFKTVGR
jgi:hypothetical protein